MMKAYKGFRKDMTCRGFQYEEGETYETDHAELCVAGFHACEHPLDVFKYYDPSSSVYHEVELDEVSDERTVVDSKVVAKKIRIGKRLSARDLVYAQHEMVTGQDGIATVRKDGVAAAGYCGAVTAMDDDDVAVAGYHGAVLAEHGIVAAAGNLSAVLVGDHGIATVGDNGVAVGGFHGVATADNGGMAVAGSFGVATAGPHGKATTEDYGVAASGDFGKATTEDYGVAAAGVNGVAATGDFGIAAAGDFGKATTEGCGVASAGKWGTAKAGRYGVAASQCRSSTGANGLAVARGKCCMVRGGLGAILVIAEESPSGHDVAYWKSVQVDGSNIKADTWYELDNGHFVEVAEYDQPPL